MRDKLIFLLWLIFLAGCANVVAPTGGPPDKEPPVIDYFSPDNKTLNFQGDEIKIHFKKYMNKNSVIENVFVTPSKKMKYDWNGKTFFIEFEEKLDSNTTYSVSLGTEYTDLHSNKPTDGFSLVFSTGNHIDTGKIRGTLYDDNPAGCFIFAYRLTGINPDTLNPGHTKPSYRTQVGSSGAFEFKALKNGLYRLIAVRDQFKDEIYDEGSDAFAASSRDVDVSGDSVQTLNIKMGKTVDRNAPMLYDAEANSRRRITATFSKNIDTASVSAGSFTITDSAGTVTIPVLHAYISNAGPTKVEIITATPLDSSKKWILTATRDSSSAIRDSSGNFIQDTARKARFFSTGEKDTVSFSLLKAPFPDSARIIDPMARFGFLFSLPFEDEFVKKRITFFHTGTNEKVDFRIEWKQDNFMQIVPVYPLLSDSWYELTFRMDSLQLYSKKLAVRDTTVKLRFKTDDIRSNTTVSGIVRDSSGCGNRFGVTLVCKEKNLRYRTLTDDKGYWSIDNVKSASYTTEVFCDSDRSGTFSTGNAFPYRYAKRYWILSKPLEVKPRWKIENYIIDIK